MVLALDSAPPPQQHSSKIAKMPAIEEKGESSTATAKKALTAVSEGAPNYELPW